MRRSLFAVGGALVVLAGSAPALHAQGSSVMTHSACATAMAAAGVASPCRDGSAVLFNPGALALQPSAAGLSWTGISTGGSFTYDLTGERAEREKSTASVPAGFLSWRGGGRWAAGLGVFAPYGLGIFWSEEFEGRFTSYDTDLTNVYVQPTVSFQAAPWLSFGAGVDYVLGSIEINQRLDLATTPVPAPLAPFPGATFGNFGVPLGTDFVDVRLSGDATGFGFHLGAVLQASERLSFGARYLSEVELEYDGTARFEQIESRVVLPTGQPLDPLLAAQFQPGAPLADQGISTSLTLPAQLVVGVAVRPIPTLQLLADYQWTGWESFDQAEIAFEAGMDQPLVLDYQNTDTYRLGAELWATEALALRGGFIYNTAAQREFSVSPLLPEAERNYYTAGIGYRFASGLGIDAGYQLVDQADRRGRVRGRAPGLGQAELEALNVGVYSADAHVFGVTLSYRFGPR